MRLRVIMTSPGRLACINFEMTAGSAFLTFHVPLLSAASARRLT
jgi:hypothetical protein